MSDYTTATDDQLDGERPFAAVIRRAHARWKRCYEWESQARTNWIMDLKFDSGDSYNNYQWPVEIASTRSGKVTLTVNETRQHNLHIINEAKQNKSGVKYRAVGDEATEEAAEAWEGIYRHIANISNVQMAQGIAIGFQVRAGLGYTWVTSDFTSEDSFDQDVFIRGIANPLTVMMDCDITETDGSDARYGFIYADRPRDEVELKHPELRGVMPLANAVDDGATEWVRKDHIRVANYYEITEEADELLGNDEGVTILRSKVPASLVKRWEAEAEANGSKLKRRPVVTKRVHRYEIIGDRVVDDERVPGTSIPIIPWVGEVTVIDGILDRKGHTRALISAQQMENYNWSASVEFGALQSKSPWLVPAETVADYMTYYATANFENHAFLPYKHRDDQGREIPKPERQQPPMSAPVYLDGVALARQFMLSASGQYEAEMGAPGNEKSGRAINERQRQGDRATYHFIDNQAIAIRRQGQIVQEWVREIYDTPRVIKTMGEDRSEVHLQIDPDADKAYQAAEEGAAAIFNPNLGKFDVVPDVGPDYATQRQEAFNAIVQIITRAPALIEKIGDLLFKVADFPLADEIAERLKPGMPTAAQAAIDELQKQLRASNTRLGEAMQALTEERLKVKAKDSDAVIDAFDADTRRLSALKDFLAIDPEALRQLVREEMAQAAQDNLGPAVMGAAQGLDLELAGEPPPGASGALPIRVPDVGQQAAQPGGV